MKKTILTKPYLTFKLSNEFFAIELSNIVTLLDSDRIIENPYLHNLLVGEINMNGYHLPIVDLRKRLDVQPTKNRKGTRVIVLELDRNSKLPEVGLIVDEIEEIVRFNVDQILPVYKIKNLFNTGIYSGIAKSNGDCVFLLNIHTIFYPNESKLFSEFTSSTINIGNSITNEKNDKLKEIEEDKLGIGIDLEFAKAVLNELAYENY